MTDVDSMLFSEQNNICENNHDAGHYQYTSVELFSEQ